MLVCAARLRPCSRRLVAGERCSRAKDRPQAFSAVCTRDRTNRAPDCARNRDKALPAVSIALVEDQQVVWSRGFGHADPARKKPATPETVYRVGSVSKLFTDIAVMQLVERGQVDLDAPVTTYLPDFKPSNPFNTPITLRHLMSHRAGLVREPPVGHYFDDTAPSLAQTVASLNGTTLVYAPGNSDQILQCRHRGGRPGARGARQAAVCRCAPGFGPGADGSRKSSFAPSAPVTPDLAQAFMWTYHGTRFDAPTFQLGMAPAGSMYSTVTDLGPLHQRAVQSRLAGRRSC